VLRGYLGAKADKPRRIYLSARFNQWVEFDAKDLLHEFDYPEGDDTTVIWLRWRRRPYRLHTISPLDAGAGFVRGQLLDDFLSQPEAESAWEEQVPGSTRARSTFHCAA
jgi:hypothetical protein